MDWSYPSNPQGVESVWLPNAYLESVLAAFQPRQGDQTAHEILRGHTCSVQAPQNHVPDEPIWPSRPRELPFPFHLSDTSPTCAPLVAQPRPATPRPYANSYTSVGDYAQSFFHPEDDKPDVSRSLQGYLPIPDGRQSSHSELAANLDFLVEVSKGPPTSKGRHDAHKHHGQTLGG
ncbi:hypothetical protein FA13DRAFT_778973 [Coprinellus micaceus]|uniref:Uncharacterized protein n=1 Tax=Coprinellus micaceus TaxID=71717 RepID=A0A4Y7T3G0_COPMI|nr:hypothetical protein FA13DRAFT_778973 [Coprinellus micaceus]